MALPIARSAVSVHAVLSKETDNRLLFGGATTRNYTNHIEDRAKRRHQEPVAAYENIREVVVCEQKVLRTRTDLLASSQQTVHKYSPVQLWTSFDDLSEMIKPFR